MDGNSSNMEASKTNQPYLELNSGIKYLNMD